MKTAFNSVLSLRMKVGRLRQMANLHHLLQTKLNLKTDFLTLLMNVSKNMGLKSFSVGIPIMDTGKVLTVKVFPNTRLKTERFIYLNG